MNRRTGEKKRRLSFHYQILLAARTCQKSPHSKQRVRALTGLMPTVDEDRAELLGALLTTWGSTRLTDGGPLLSPDCSLCVFQEALSGGGRLNEPPQTCSPPLDLEAARTESNDFHYYAGSDCSPLLRLPLGPELLFLAMFACRKELSQI